MTIFIIHLTATAASQFNSDHSRTRAYMARKYTEVSQDKNNRTTTCAMDSQGGDKARLCAVCACRECRERETGAE